MNVRTVPVERGLMIAELHLDGIKTHITMRKQKCPLYKTPFDFKIREALSGIRSSRDIFRNDIGSKQWTLTTRGKSANRHGLWDMNTKASFQCPFCKD